MNTQKTSFWQKTTKGLHVAIKSIKFVAYNKKLLFFPVLTMTLIVGSIGLYDAIFYVHHHEHITAYMPKTDKTTKRHEAPKKEIIIFFWVITFACILFFTFSNVALSHATSQALASKPIHIGSSLLFSFSRLITIIVFTTAAFVVRFLVDMLKNRKNRFINWLSSLLGAVLEIAWAIATFLVIPIIAHEKLDAFKSIKRSAELMKKTFGENLGAIVGFDSLKILIIVSWGLLNIVAGIVPLVFSVPLHVYMPIGLIIFALSIILMLIALIILSASITVFKTAVYHYAVGNQIGFFSQEEISTSFVQEKRS